MSDIMSAVSISPRFRITIPKDVREDSDLNVGDRLAFLRKGNEIVIFKVPEKPLKKMGGSLTTKKNVKKILQELKKEDLKSERSRGV
jgi:AbrB family looped-hinge helix DNA binding protein